MGNGRYCVVRVHRKISKRVWWNDVVQAFKLQCKGKEATWELFLEMKKDETEKNEWKFVL